MPVKIVQNTALPSMGAQQPLEPSVATTGDDSFYTAWRVFYLSSDRGNSFVQPSYGAAGSIFPEGYADDYVDQSAIWSPGVARVVWAMIRKPAGGGSFVLRIAFTSRSKLSASKARDWSYFDITPAQLGVAGRHLDYPQLSLSAGFLYITAHYANSELTGVAGSVIIRVSLGQLEDLSPGAVNFQFFRADGIFNFGAAQRCIQRLYWAGHVSNTVTRVYWWDEHSNTVFWQDVKVPGWSGQSKNYKSLTPDGDDWLSFEWGRTTGARVGPDSVVFGWTAGSNPDRPHPYIYLAQFRQEFLTGKVSLSGRRDIWHREHGWAVPTLGSNSLGRLAMTCAWGGGPHFVNHAVGFVQLPLSASSAYENVASAMGSMGAPRWGDFISLRNHDRLDQLFIATGYTLHPSASDRNVAGATPRYVVFSDERG